MVDNAHDPDLVYFTTDRDLARAWCFRSNGALLRVEPIGPVEPDPDYPGTSFSAAHVVVREVVEHPVTMSHLAARKAFAAYHPDEFDEKGFLLASERLAGVLGACDGDITRFRMAGRYPNPQRFTFWGGQLRYITDDIELIVMARLLSLDPPMNWLVAGCRNEESAL
jgi:hypothetical protein